MKIKVSSEMMESTINASKTLGGIGIGDIAQPAHKPRNQSVSTADVAGAQSISGSSETLGRRAKVGAAVEAMNDVALVALVLEGDQDVFSVLVERYKDAVQNLAYRMLGNITEAEDVTQETFVRAYTQLASY
ncbi:MAG TPA: sigma factor, partial [Ktedonobacteraceae bacterium]